MGRDFNLDVILLHSFNLKEHIVKLAHFNVTRENGKDELVHVLGFSEGVGNN